MLNLWLAPVDSAVSIRDAGNASGGTVTDAVNHNPSIRIIGCELPTDGI
jgi:hypothetical protein